MSAVSRGMGRGGWTDNPPPGKWRGLVGCPSAKRPADMDSGGFDLAVVHIRVSGMFFCYLCLSTW